VQEEMMIVVGFLAVLRADAENWLVKDSSVRFVSFYVETSKVNDPAIFILGQRSGFIVLRANSFAISTAFPFRSVISTFESGVLTREQMGESQQKLRKKMEYGAALSESLDEGVFQGLGTIVDDVLSKPPSRIAPPSVQYSTSGRLAVAEFIKHWGSLKRVTWVWSDPKKRGASTNIRCTFKVELVN
jgi:hypothetical protein